ncbi:PTS fructose transporter subunit IIA [Escherichia coli]|nr:PTS fructose transporter subunit IIA [Escherichia coli]EKY6712074.1 PTS fructose transporter subunit IIA [Escherichia coli]HBH5319721.1 PTS fructose transporter subunit IIA [Escherichia coli]HDB9911658.1 PTS fructose transporter subunit IIA [Escherichia coli]
MAALTASCIALNIQGNSDYSILRQLATIACQNGFITDSHTFLQTLLRREKMHSTGFGSGIAVPHGKRACVKLPFVLFARKAQAINWKASDGEGENLIVNRLAIPHGWSEQERRFRGFFITLAQPLEVNNEVINHVLIACAAADARHELKIFSSLASVLCTYPAETIAGLTGYEGCIALLRQE